MSESNPPNRDTMYVVRNEFQPSVRMTAVTRSFLAPSAERLSFRYFSQRAAVLTYDDLLAANTPEQLGRIDMMAQNLEKPLYPSGIVDMQIGTTALKLSFILSPSATDELNILGNRLEPYMNESMTEWENPNVIIVRAHRFHKPSDERVEHAQSEFEAVMQEENLFRGYSFRSKGLAIYPLPSQNDTT